MLNPKLKGYEVTAKVPAQKFREVSYGVIDLATIREGMAKKLVQKGFLIKKEEKATEKAAKPKKEAEESK